MSGLPLQRHSTVVNGVPVNAALLNDLQDAIIRHERHYDYTYDLLKALATDVDVARATSITLPTLRPIRKCGAFSSQVAGSGPTLKFYGGTWIDTALPQANATPWSAYAAADDEISIALAAPPGLGFYRWDIVSAKLTLSTDDATYGLPVLSYTKTEGTPNAVEASAAEPSTPATYTKICAVLQETSGTLVTESKIRDYRVPIGLREHLIPAWQFDLTGQWGLNTTNSRGSITAGAISRNTWAVVPSWLERWGRLLTVGVYGAVNASAVALLVRLTLSGAARTRTTLATPTASVLGTTGALREKDLSASDAPIWTNGYPAPAGGVVGMAHLALEVQSANSADELWHARFVTAGHF